MGCRLGYVIRPYIDLSGGSKKTYQEAGWIWSAHPVSHHAVSVFKDPLACSPGPLRARRKEPDRRGFSHFPSNVPSLPNSRERDSAVVISASLPSRWVPYLKWEKAIMASVWITTDYNNGRPLPQSRRLRGINGCRAYFPHLPPPPPPLLSLQG